MSEGGHHPGGWASWISLALTLVSMCAVGYSRIHSLEEAKTIDEARDAKYDEARQKLEERVHVIETSRELEKQIGALTVQVTALNAQVQDLREQLRGRRGD